MKDGSRGDDFIGYSHVLLVESAARLTHSQAGIKILTSDDAEGIGPWLREHGLTAALVRPDRYIRDTARNDAELDRLIATMTPPTHVPSAA